MNMPQDHFTRSRSTARPRRPGRPGAQHCLIRLCLSAILVLIAAPAVGQEPQGEIRTTTMQFRPGSAQVDGYEQGTMEVRYRFVSCFNSLFVVYSPQGGSIRAGSSYWHNGERVAVPGTIAPPRYENSIGISGVALHNNARVGTFGDGFASINISGMTCGSGNAKEIGRLPEHLRNASAAAVLAYLNTLRATITTPETLRSGAVASAVLAQRREAERQRQEEARKAEAERLERERRAAAERAEQQRQAEAARQAEQRREREAQEARQRDEERRQEEQRIEADRRVEEAQREQSEAQQAQREQAARDRADAEQRAREQETADAEQRAREQQTAEAQAAAWEAGAPLRRIATQKCVEAQFASEAGERDRASALYQEIRDLSNSGVLVDAGCLRSAQKFLVDDAMLATVSLMSDIYEATGITVGITMAMIPIAGMPEDQLHSIGVGVNASYSLLFADFLLGDNIIGPMVPSAEPDWSFVGCMGPYGTDNHGNQCSDYYGDGPRWGFQYAVNLGVVSPIGLGSVFPMVFVGHTETVEFGGQQQYGVGLVLGYTKITSSGREVYDGGGLRVGVASSPGGLAGYLGLGFRL